MPANRNHAFDLLCGICIIRMVMNHAISMCGLRNYNFGGFCWYDLMGWTFFFMSFFFFKAGYFNKTTAAHSGRYVVDRTKRLLVPYISWSIIGFIVFFGMIAMYPHIYNADTMPSFHWSHLYETSHSYGNGPLWFLMSFYVAYICIHFIEKIPYLHWFVLVFPLVSYWLYTIDSPLWLSLDNVFMGIFFFYLGHAWKWLIRVLRRTQTLILSTVLVVVFILSNTFIHGEYTMSTNTWDGNPFGIIISLISILTGLSGILLSVPLRRIPFICYIGEHSMVYFVAHYPLMYFYIFLHKAYGVSFKYNWGECLLLMVFMFVVCTWLVPYVEHIPLLSGRWKKKA